MKRMNRGWIVACAVLGVWACGQDAESGVSAADTIVLPTPVSVPVTTITRTRPSPA